MSTKRFFQAGLSAMLIAVMALPVQAFSLRGIRDTWQSAALSYGVLASDLGGPMNLGEEYRLNVPLLTYGFDSTFLNYFGSNGVVAVDAAFAILNAIPHVSQMSSTLAEFPTQSKLQNFTAQTLGIQDMKSTVLGIMVAQMGLANPERFVWTLRDRQVFGTPPVTNYLVIKRNFNPITLNPDSFVNGTLYTYDIREFINPTYSDAVERPVDPQATTFSSVASVDDLNGPSAGLATALNAGEFFTGLTRDDMGGLRYLLRFNNFNVETISPGVTLVPQSALGVFGPNGGASTFLFGPGGIQFSSPWGPSGTNVATNVIVTTNTLVTTALRPGIGKVSFQKVLFDSLLYSTLSVTNIFTDTVITNSISTNQLVRRIQTVPDILFTAADLGQVVAAGVPTPILFTRSQIPNWTSFAGLNTVGGGAARPGPGVINPGAGAAAAITITFSTLGPYFNNSTPFSLSEVGPGFVWGYIPNVTDQPIVFPDGTTVQDLENRVLGR